jgi:CheY-like chemotaxis protein
MRINTTHKVLIVDDDQNDIELTKRVLSKSGFKVPVETVTRGDTAFEVLRKVKDLPSLILLDLKMPGMSGIDILRQIRADERLKNVTVIVVTNSLLDSDRNESFAAGADDFLQKAFDIDRFGRDMKSILERWLKG